LNWRHEGFSKISKAWYLVCSFGLTNCLGKIRIRQN
jgi:hypothetical protein